MDHVFIFDDRHLRAVLAEYMQHFTPTWRRARDITLRAIEALGRYGWRTFERLQSAKSSRECDVSIQGGIRREALGEDF